MLLRRNFLWLGGLLIFASGCTTVSFNTGFSEVSAGVEERGAGKIVWNSGTELDKEAGTLVVDRFLYTSMAFPGNYGFVPHTLSDDGDPIDVVVANTRPIVPGAVINVRPVGVLKMQDEAGGDEKVLAVPVPRLTKRYAHVMNYTDLPEIALQQMQHFFEHYKDLEPGKWVKVLGWGDAAEAKRMIVEAIERENKRPKTPLRRWTD